MPRASWNYFYPSHAVNGTYFWRPCSTVMALYQEFCWKAQVSICSFKNVLETKQAQQQKNIPSLSDLNETVFLLEYWTKGSNQTCTGSHGLSLQRSDWPANQPDWSISGLSSKRMFLYGAFSHKCQFINSISFHGLKCLKKLEEGSYMFKGQTWIR